MRQNLSKGMIVAGCATTLLSLWGIPALADSRTDAATAETLGTLSGHSAADVPVDAPAKTDDVPAYGAQGADRGADRGAEGGDAGRTSDHGRTGGQRDVDGYGDDSGSGRVVGQGDSGGSGGIAGQGDSGGSGGIAGHGDSGGSGGIAGRGDSGGSDWITGLGDVSGSDWITGHGVDSGRGDDVTGDYGDDETPPTTPPAPLPSSPPRVATPPKPAPHVHTPSSGPSTAPPAARPEQPPSLAETGVGSETTAASGVAAFLMASGVIFYRRGRAASRR
ncbi:hypothetical protein [Streptomyces hyaluromycini]|uniref:hypothetical protein n=1 Tax=Streptomyces hyaluromycini TaxID=1377993 RepID=UPI0011AEBAC4|nr:hypothetical protein [Streptomyces hyaluromycini]